ncbi:hypothetical protein LIA77_11904 [Sarocladium implicatum]|nr:hypothetical protein LIA77_11904 [Sarocladium implicatum]
MLVQSIKLPSRSTFVPLRHVSIRRGRRDRRDEPHLGLNHDTAPQRRTPTTPSRGLWLKRATCNVERASCRFEGQPRKLKPVSEGAQRHDGNTGQGCRGSETATRVGLRFRALRAGKR